MCEFCLLVTVKMFVLYIFFFFVLQVFRMTTDGRNIKYTTDQFSEYCTTRRYL